MTTAHRPTFHPALASQNSTTRGAPTTKVFSKELPGHRLVKERVAGQSSTTELAERDFKAELEAKEAAHFGAQRRAALLAGEAAPALTAETLLALEDIADEPNPFPEDADDDGPRNVARKRAAPEDVASDDGSSQASSDDEEAELLRELEKIKQERAAEEMKKKAEEDKVAADAEREEILKSNPLVVMSNVGDGAGGGIAKRWEDDTIFKNQVKLSSAQKADQRKKRFINDPVRSEFHKKFLLKYVT